MAESILVTSYKDPDLDGFAGAIAMAELLNNQGKEAEPGFFGEVNVESDFLMKRFGFEYPKMLEKAQASTPVILVDASEVAHLEGLVQPEQVVEIIDHRKDNDAKLFIHAAIHIELVGAACTLVVERFMENKSTPSRMSAILLAGGVVSNTLNFKSKTTMPRDHEAFHWLAEAAAFPAELIHDMFAAKSDVTGEKLFARLDADFGWFVIAGRKVGIAHLEVIGARKLAQEREQEILMALAQLKQTYGTEDIFCSLIDLEEDRVFLVAQDTAIKTAIQVALGVSFSGTIAQRESLIMRKEIVPLLRAHLESTQP